MLKQTLFFSKPCKLSFRLKQLVEEEKRYTTGSTSSGGRTSCGLLKKRRNIQRDTGCGVHPTRCGLLKKRRNIQLFSKSANINVVVAC